MTPGIVEGEVTTHASSMTPTELTIPTPTEMPFTQFCVNEFRKYAATMPEGYVTPLNNVRYNLFMS